MYWKVNLKQKQGLTLHYFPSIIVHKIILTQGRIQNFSPTSVFLLHLFWASRTMSGNEATTQLKRQLLVQWSAVNFLVGSKPSLIKHLTLPHPDIFWAYFFKVSEWLVQRYLPLAPPLCPIWNIRCIQRRIFVYFEEIFVSKYLQTVSFSFYIKIYTEKMLKKFSWRFFRVPVLLKRY